MAFRKEFGLQLYVEDVEKEKAFFEAIGFEITGQGETMGYPWATMKTCPDSTVLFTIYAKAFIRQVSPEVIEMKPSILFESDHLAALHGNISALTGHCSEISMEPFPNFNFGTPGGLHFAVKGVD